MPCQILVSNKSSVERADIIALFDGDHKWGARETMSAWVLAGNNKEDWDRSFSLVIVTDKTKSDLSYLSDTLPNEKSKYYFAEPVNTDPLYIELFINGQVSRPFDVVTTYIRERS